MSSVGRTTGRTLAAMFTALALVTAGTGLASAQRATHSQDVSAFLANPGQLLQQNPNGGRNLSLTVQELALADPTTFNVLIGLLPNANERQRGAIGEGLAQAAKIEVLTNQPLATDWQQQIGGITDTAFKTAATNAFGDVVLGSVGGGPLGGAGGGPTGPNNGPANNGTPPGNPTVPVQTQFFTFTAGTSSAGAPPANPPNGPVSQ